MKYDQKIILKNGDEAWLRNGDASDGDAVYGIFNLTHAETDYLLSYPDENSFDPEQEAQFLEEKTNSSRRVWDKRFEGILGDGTWESSYRGLHRMCQRSRICTAGIECCS